MKRIKRQIDHYFQHYIFLVFASFSSPFKIKKP